MRVALSLMLSFLAVSCAGPSTAQIRAAKTAEYKAPADQILDLAIQVAQRKYKVSDVDPKGRFFTDGQWYSENGARRGTSNEGNGDYIVNMQGGDVRLSLEVQVLGATQGRVIVVVTPHTQQLVAGSPQPRELAPDDPNLPPWVPGRVDQLSVDIYEAAKQFAGP